MIDKYFFIFLCQAGSNIETQIKCQDALRETIKELHIYQSIKEKEKYYRLYAEDKLTKPGFWAMSSLISSVSTRRLYLTGHNIIGIDSVSVKLGEKSELALTWSF